MAHVHKCDHGRELCMSFWGRRCPHGRRCRYAHTIKHLCDRTISRGKEPPVVKACATYFEHGRCIEGERCPYEHCQCTRTLKQIIVNNLIVQEMLWRLATGGSRCLECI